MNGFWLKLLAAATMLLDHVGALFLPQHFVLRIIGRISFPIFAFLLAQGFVHSRSPKRYLLRLCAFALVSEAFFDYFLYKRFFALQGQNVFFTLALGLLGLMLFVRLKEGALGFVCVAALALVAEAMATDYGWYGVLLIFVFYCTRKSPVKMTLLVVALNCAVTLTRYYQFGPEQLNYVFMQLPSIAALLPILLYTGTPGPRLGYWFYWFYPAHLLVLGVAHTLQWYL